MIPTVLSVGVHIHEIRDRTHYHPCVVSNHPFVTTDYGEIADELNKWAVIDIELVKQVDEKTYLADIWDNRVRCYRLCEAD